MADQTDNGRGPSHQFALLSHDLRSALSDVLGGLRLIDSDKLDGETQSQIDRITASGETLARLLDKTLKPQMDGFETSVTRASNLKLAGFLDDLRRRWSGRAQSSDIGFEVRTKGALPAILTVDRVSLDRVLSNLLSNAIKFSETGTVRLEASCEEKNELIFRVLDDGPGLSEAALERLFEFEGRPKEESKPGTGLGLHIAKELASLLGGRLSVTNQPDVGAIAELILPHAAWFDRNLRKIGADIDSDGSDDVDLSHLKILLAEDNTTNQLVATQMLASMGAECVVASDGLEALECIEREPFDLALLDIEMPRMSGLELIKAVRGMPGHVAHLPMVALTAYVMREHRERISAAGADGIIAKPLMSIGELGRAILDFYSGTDHRLVASVDDDSSSHLLDGEVVDRTVFDTLVETIGPESSIELLAKLQTDADAIAEGIALGRQSLDLAEIRSQTHILMSVAGAIGAVGLQRLARSLNSAANREDPGDVDQMCKDCLAGLADLQSFIQAEQNNALASAE